MVSEAQHAKALKLICAVKNGQRNVVKSILKGRGHTFNVLDMLNSPAKSSMGTTALLEACHKANRDARYQGGQEDALNIVKLLLDHGADPHTKASSLVGDLIPLHEAVNLVLTRVLLKGKASVNQTDDKGESVLHICCRDSRASVDQTNQDGQSALHLSRKVRLFGKSKIRSYNLRLPTELFKYKADVNLQDKEGQTPLHLSCANKAWELTTALINNGALATIQDNAGKFPLYEVASNSPEAILDMVNLCSITPYENIELIIETCELAALWTEGPESIECMHKATLLRIEHNIPKRTLEPLEYYGFCKEWETIEQLETCRGDVNQLKFQAILAKERIHQGQHEKLMELIQEDLISAVLSASKSEAGKLLKHHLDIWSSCKPDGDGSSSFENFLKKWKNELDKNFEPFDTLSIVQFTQLAIENLAKSVGVVRHDSVLLQGITSLIMKLYRRNRQVENTSKNEEMLAKELLQQLMDIERNGQDVPLPHLITRQNFNNRNYYDRPYDYELMKMLLESGINVNAVDFYGDTILHTAVLSVAHGPYDTDEVVLSQDNVNQVIINIELLLEQGVYPNAQNEEYETAIDMLGDMAHHGNNDGTYMAMKSRIKQILQHHELQNSLTLKHMAAVAVQKSGYSYENLLPDALVKFVDLHKPMRHKIYDSDSYSDDDFDDDSDSSYGYEFDDSYYGYLFQKYD